jgi:hypothetical protein
VPRKIWQPLSGKKMFPNWRQRPFYVNGLQSPTDCALKNLLKVKTKRGVLNAGIHNYQGEQIGRIFADWAIVYFVHFI